VSSGVQFAWRELIPIPCLGKILIAGKKIIVTVPASFSRYKAEGQVTKGVRTASRGFIGERSEGSGHKNKNTNKGESI